MTVRLLLGASGVAVAAYGGVLLWGLGRSDLREVVVWLGAGVLVHDLLLVPLVAVLLLLARRLLPQTLWGPLAGGLVVLGSLTLLAVPVLGRFGASPDNPTLLDRPYLAGWVGVAGMVALGVVAAWWGARDRGADRPRDRRPHRSGRT